MAEVPNLLVQLCNVLATLVQVSAHSREIGGGTAEAFDLVEQFAKTTFLFADIAHKLHLGCLDAPSLKLVSELRVHGDLSCLDRSLNLLNRSAEVGGISKVFFSKGLKLLLRD